MKVINLIIILLLHMTVVQSQTTSITEIGNVAFINPSDTAVKNKRIELARMSNEFIKKYYPTNKQTIYLMLNANDTNAFNVYCDNIYGSSLDDDNNERSLKYYKPGIRVDANYSKEVILRLLDYGLQNSKILCRKRQILLKKKSPDKEALLLSENEIKEILSRPLNKRIKPFL